MTKKYYKAATPIDQAEIILFSDYEGKSFRKSKQTKDSLIEKFKDKEAAIELINILVELEEIGMKAFSRAHVAIEGTLKKERIKRELRKCELLKEFKEEGIIT